MPAANLQGRDLLRQRVEMWRRTDAELAAIRQRDAESVTVQEAIRQIFDGMDFPFAAAAATTSGLVEQQMCFSRIRMRNSAQPPDPESGP